MKFTYALTLAAATALAAPAVAQSNGSDGVVISVLPPVKPPVEWKDGYWSYTYRDPVTGQIYQVDRIYMNNSTGIPVAVPDGTPIAMPGGTPTTSEGGTTSGTLVRTGNGYAIRADGSDTLIPVTLARAERAGVNPQVFGLD